MIAALPRQRHATSEACRHAPSAPTASRGERLGFTLLEVVIALAILGLVTMAVSSINSAAVSSHIYARRLTVATLLARSKMTDLEQELYDKGLSPDNTEEGGNFREEGWPQFQWRARILAPQTKGLPPEQLLASLFNLPLGDASGADPTSNGLGALAAMFGAGAGKQPGGASPITGTAVAAGAGAGALGPLSGLMQAQFTALVDQITKSVREVHLTVSWKEGSTTETLDLVTHIVSLGPGTDRNGGNGAVPSTNPNAWVRVDTGAVVANPVPAPNGSGSMVDPSDGQPVISAAQWSAARGAALGVPGLTRPGPFGVSR